MEGAGKEIGGAKKKWKSLKAGGEKTWEEGREEKEEVEMTMKIQQGQWKSEKEEACKRRKMNKIIKGKETENRRGKKLVEEQIEKRTKKRR